jgi:hypothetical protein
VSIPAQSSDTNNLIGLSLLGDTKIESDGNKRLIVGFCGELKEKENTHVCICQFSFGLSVACKRTETSFSIS